MTLRAALLLSVVGLGTQIAAQESAPLSAIDWLSESVAQPDVIAAAPIVDAPRPGTQARRIPPPDEHPVSDNATAPTVSVQPLGAPAPRALGVLPSTTTGLPVTLWENSEAEIIGALLRAQETDTLPALQEQIVTLALARANPPLISAEPNSFLLARIDTLLAMGALEQAQALIEDARPETPDLVRRWFDVALLTGTENAPCRALRQMPNAAPTPAAQAFCLARSGDWSAAALTLNTARALGDMDQESADLVSRFLDPELYEGEPALPRPDTVTPLAFRMFEAIGTPLGSEGLPPAFRHSDLRPNLGWKAQLDAAERLARAGALSDNRLIGLYTARVPAASGGVWERAKAVNALRTALDAEDDHHIADALQNLWREAQAVDLISPLARHFAPDLVQATLEQDARALQFRTLLLSDSYEEAALKPELAETDPFLAAVARGTVADTDSQRDPARERIRSAFSTDPDPSILSMSVEQGRTGEAILRSIAVVQQGLDGDAMAYGTGLATLRALGLEDLARRIALQELILS